MTGARPGEAVALRWKDTDLEARAISIGRALTRVEGARAFKDPKTRGSRRTLPIPETLASVLRAHRAMQAAQALRLGDHYDREADLVFANELGAPIDLRNLTSRHFKPALERAGLPASLRLYDLRHTHATALLTLGIHPKVVAERLGHASTRMTLDVYSHVLPGMQEEAVRALEQSLIAKLEAGADGTRSK